MKILLLNPKYRADITELMMTVGRPVASPGTLLVPLTAPRGVPYISTRTEAQIGGAVALEPVIDQVIAAVKQAEALLALSLRKATAGTFRRPDAKPTSGLAGPLAARLEDREA
jgi:Asp/Glu/hydantoin racemase